MRLSRNQQILLVVFLVLSLSYRYAFRVYVGLLTPYIEWKVQPPPNIIPSHWNFEGESEGNFIHRFVHIDRTLDDQITNATLHYVTAGNRKNPAVVFFHGSTDTWYEWHNQMEDLKNEFFVISFDMKGYGQSSKPKSLKMWSKIGDKGGNFSAHMLADEVVAAIDNIGVSEFHLVTIDLSSHSLYRIPVQYPDRVLSYVRMQSPVGVLDMKNHPEYKLFKKAPKQAVTFLETHRDTIIRSLFQRHEKSVTNPRAYQSISNDELNRILHEFSYDGNALSWVQYINFLEPSFKESLEAYLEYNCPMFILQGANDPVQPPYYFDGSMETVVEGDFFWPWSDYFPFGPVLNTHPVKNGKTAVDFFPKAPVALFESVAEAGHFLPLEKPKYTSDSLRLFLKGHYDEIRKRAGSQSAVNVHECDNSFGGLVECSSAYQKIEL